MEVQERNSTRIYALSTGPSLPEWIGERARRNLAKRDSSIRRRIELLQDFAMPASSSKIKASQDGRYIIASGSYAPRIRCFELAEMGMKFEQYVDAEIVDMALLSSHYGKMALLQNDRTVIFHTAYGNHASLRIPTFGRALAYEPTTCDLLVACQGKKSSGSKGGGHIYRINLEEGRFSTPLEYNSIRDKRNKTKNNNSLSGAVTATPSKKAGAVVGGSCISVSPTHALTALGGDDGIVRFWDNRLSTSASDMNLNPFCTLDVQSSTSGFGFYDTENIASFGNYNPGEVSSISFDSTGMYLAAGTMGGNVALYDIRSSKPLHVKEHQYGMPIHSVRFHSGSGTILSSDAKLVKIWRSKPSATFSSANYDDNNEFSTSSSGKSNSDIGSIVANVEGAANFTNFIVAGDEKDSSGNSSGLILCSGEQPKMQAFYVPALGSAPRWCSFLDTITEELEERDHSEQTTTGSEGIKSLTGGGDIYEDYKFLTRDEIDKLNLHNLVGTPLLRGYMHGFFIDIGLYNRVRSVANPFEYEEYRKKKIRQKMEEKRASLIAPKGDAPKVKVNATLAQRLENKADKGKNNQSGKVAKNLLKDDRFGSLFKNPDFEIDEDDYNFKLRNPSGAVALKMNRHERDDMDSDADSVQEDSDEIDQDEAGWGDDDEIQYDDENDGYDDSDDDNDSVGGGNVRGENYEDVKAQMKEDKKAKKQKMSSKKENKKMKLKKNILQEADDDFDDSRHRGDIDQDPSSKSNRKRDESKLSLEERLKLEEERMKYVQVRREGISKEVTFIPKDVRKKNMDRHQGDSEGDGKKRKRRDIKELGFKNPF